MNLDEMNLYIQEYVEQNQTGQALMLTGSRGIGKSYYIRNTLMPFLSKGENGCHQCVAVSLNGISDISEISKRIYFELCFANIASDDCRGDAVIGKTVLNDIMIGASISAQNVGLKKTVDAIGLRGKLIILESVERSCLSILSLMGYVNRLTEQDGARVLMVADEDALIKQTAPPVTEGYETRREEQMLSPEAEEYLIAKEKTICETLRFEPNASQAIKSILDEYAPIFRDFFDDSIQETVEQLLGEVKPDEAHNLRVLQCACRRAADIYKHIAKADRKDTIFMKCMFLGIVAFSAKFCNTRLPEKWSGYDDMSFELGDESYPLFRFCHTYILTQAFSVEALRRAQRAYAINLELNGIRGLEDEDVAVICDFQVRNEDQVRASLLNLRAKLRSDGLIPVYSFGKLAYYLISLKHLLDDSEVSKQIDECKEHMLTEIEKHSDRVDIYRLFQNDQIPDDSQPDEELEEFKQQATDSLRPFKDGTVTFTYDITRIPFEFTAQKLQLNVGGFCSKLDIAKMSAMLRNCSAQNVFDIREIFRTVYRDSRKELFSGNELTALQALREETDKCAQDTRYDKIQRYQLTMLSGDLNEYILYLS